MSDRMTDVDGQERSSDVLFPSWSRMVARIASPGSFADSVRNVLRDVSMLAGSFAGVRRPVYLSRGREVLKAPAEESRGITPRTLRVTGINRETPDAVTVTFEDPTGRCIEFLPGQFLTVILWIAGRQYRRAYSLTSAQGGRHVTITVKRVHDGVVSNYVNAQLRAGDMIDVQGPSGDFTVRPDALCSRDIVLFAGGSGITPIVSITQAVLSTEPESRVTLFYGNRSLADVIFLTRIEDLSTQYPTRFTCVHVLQDPPPQWKGREGMLDAANVAKCLDHFESQRGVSDQREYYVCGPEPMMQAVRSVLAGTRRGTIHEERFLQPHLRAQRVSDNDTVRTAQRLALRTESGTTEVIVRPDQTLLEGGMAAGVDMPFSCTMGGCGACMLKALDGTAANVEMEEPNCLDAKEREAGCVLPCVSRARGHVILEVVR